jgi:hypothetical protein
VPISAAPAVRPLVVSALLLLAAAPPGAAQGAPPGNDSASFLGFQHYEVNLPSSEGWTLLSRAAEDEAISVQLVWQKEQERFKLADVTVAREGMFERAVLRQPSVAFNWLASREVAQVRDEAVGRSHLTWLGSRRDSFTDGGRTFYRLWYAARSPSTVGQTSSVYLFPASFATDGFFLHATLHYWSRKDREDPSIIDEFEAMLRSLRARQPALDQRVLPEVADALGKARKSLPYVYYDARARAMHSPHDTTRATCWTQVEDSLAIGLQATRLPGVTFFSMRARAPAPGQREQGERFGKAFDRDGDGRFDLVYFSEGWGKGQDGRDLRTFYVAADDNGDGRVDGMVFEDGDNNRDALIDHSIFVQDRARKGEPDRAWVFDTDIGNPVRPLPHQGTVFLLTRTSRPGAESADFGAEFRTWNRYLAWLNRAAAACRGTHPAGAGKTRRPGGR